MSEEDNDKTNIDNKKEEIKSEENQSQGESSPPDAQPSESSGSPSENNENQGDMQSKVEEKKEHEVIHKNSYLKFLANSIETLNMRLRFVSQGRYKWLFKPYP